MVSFLNNYFQTIFAIFVALSTLCNFSWWICPLLVSTASRRNVRWRMCPRAKEVEAMTSTKLCNRCVVLRYTARSVAKYAALICLCFLLHSIPSSRKKTFEQLICRKDLSVGGDSFDFSPDGIAYPRKKESDFLNTSHPTWFRILYCDLRKIRFSRPALGVSHGARERCSESRELASV